MTRGWVDGYFQNMNKTQFIEKVAMESGISQQQAQKVLVNLTTIIVRTLKKGDRVVLSGFGTFLLSQRGERVGRNPQTGEAIKIKASQIPHFRPGKEFKQILQRS